MLSRVTGRNSAQCLGHRRIPRGVTPRIKSEEQVRIRRSGDNSTEVEWNIKGVKARTLLGLVSPAYDREPHRIINKAREVDGELSFQ